MKKQKQFPGVVFRIIAGGALILLFNSCVETTADALLFLNQGLHPPAVLSVEMSNSRRIEIQCDSHLSSASMRIDPAIEILDSGVDGKTAWFELGEDAETGRRYKMIIVIENDRGHSTQAVRIVSGYNPEPVTMIFNEIIMRGSGNNPDCIEFLVLEGGNLGGMAWYLGTPDLHDAVYFFPGIRVEDGEYIVLHVRPEGIPEERDELGEDLSESGGRQAHPEARDLWLPQETGLPSNNAVLTLFDGGNIPVDSFIYSNRDSDSDQQYRGFGTSKMLRWADQIAGYGTWTYEGPQIRPEDCVSPEGSTGTRSVNRKKPNHDSRVPGSRELWYIVPTRGATIGSRNSDEVYEP
ncbi:hypothetical protein [Spirochaeta dissipatitropha]